MNTPKIEVTTYFCFELQGLFSAAFSLQSPPCSVSGSWVRGGGFVSSGWVTCSLSVCESQDPDESYIQSEAEGRLQDQYYGSRTAPSDGEAEGTKSAPLLEISTPLQRKPRCPLFYLTYFYKLLLKKRCFTSVISVTLSFTYLQRGLENWREAQLMIGASYYSLQN